jgi:multicomponent K+:H+ antiporter subunit D
MIEAALIFAFGCYGLGLLANLWRITRGPDVADRILALDTMVINLIALLIIVGLARAGSILFWKSTAVAAHIPPEEECEDDIRPEIRPAATLEVAPTMAAIALLALLAAFAGPVTDYLEDTSAQLFQPGDYIDAVLGAGEEG